MINDKLFMDVALQFASQSKCVSRKVGAVLVRGGRILSTGYNGSPPGWKNCCDRFVNYKAYMREEHIEWSTANEVHAEMNALAWAAKEGTSTDRATIYTTVQPCSDCLKNMVAAGIIEVIYLEKYDRMQNQAYIDGLHTIGVKYRQLLP